MLILSRHVDEIVDITLPTDPALLLALAGRRIAVMPVEQRGDKVRLGFDAHPFIEINRREVQEAIDRERNGAA